MQTNFSRAAMLGLAVVFFFSIARLAHAQTYNESVLYSFCPTSNCANGSQSGARLVQGANGNFYGIVQNGGPNQEGTIYEVTPTGTFTTLYTFCSLTDCDDGKDPVGLVQGTDGNFYGMTYEGGVTGDLGTFFKMTPAGALLTLYSFCSQSGCTDGSYPAGIIQGTDSNFYGVTASGGANSEGTVFKITTVGALTTLYSFCAQGGSSCTDGEEPSAALVQGTNGYFYGTTAYGGANGYGSVFELTPTETLTTLYSFCSQGGSNCTDGKVPDGLVLGTDGNLYGLTGAGGANGYGTVFKLTLTGMLTTLYSFCSEGGSHCTDGKSPEGLMQGTDGNFYGVTVGGGVNWAYYGGTAFQITPTGTFTTIYNFCSQGGADCSDGGGPQAGLTQGTDGNFYGTTYLGGDTSGAIYKLSSTVKTNSSTALTVTPNPAQLGQTISLTATVSGSNGTPTGTVTFTFNGTAFGSAELNSSGVATLQNYATGLAPGTYPVLATYSGCSTYNASSSSTVNVVLTKAASGVALTATPNPVQVGQTVTLSATAGGNDGSANGTITFSVNGTSIGSGTLDSSGVVTLSAGTKGYKLGTYPIVASYSGNADYNSSQSSVLDVVLEKAVTTTSISGAPNPVTPPASVTLIAAVIRSSADETGVPTGTVTFYYGNLKLGSGTLDEAGETSFTASTQGLAAGTYDITAEYSGDGYDDASGAAAFNITVK